MRLPRTAHFMLVCPDGALSSVSLVVPLVCTFCLRQEDELHSGVPKKKASFFLGRSPRLHFLPSARRWAALGSAQEKSKLFPWSFPSFALFAFGKKMGCTRECPRKKQAFSLVVPLVCTFCLWQEDELHSGVPKKKASFFLGRSPRLLYLCGKLQSYEKNNARELRGRVCRQHRTARNG